MEFIDKKKPVVQKILILSHTALGSRSFCHRVWTGWILLFYIFSEHRQSCDDLDKFASLCGHRLGSNLWSGRNGTTTNCPMQLGDASKRCICHYILCSGLTGLCVDGVTRTPHTVHSRKPLPSSKKLHMRVRSFNAVELVSRDGCQEWFPFAVFGLLRTKRIVIRTVQDSISRLTAVRRTEAFDSSIPEPNACNDQTGTGRSSPTRAGLRQGFGIKPTPPIFHPFSLSSDTASM